MSTAFNPGSASQPTADIELSLACRSLQRKDVLSKSDPMCVTYVCPFGEQRWVEYHRTEAIQNNHNPNFAAKINVCYRFEEQQLLRFEVYDVDSDSPNLKDHDFLGAASCSLGQIVASGKVKLPLTYITGESVAGNKFGYLIVTSEELTTLRDEVILKFSGHNLDRKDWFGTSDPFLELHKVTESGDYSLVHKTEVKKWTLNPVWKPFTIAVRSICNGDYERGLKVVCYDWNASGSHSFIGEFYTNLKTLSEGPGPSNQYACINPKKQAKKKDRYVNSGEIRVDYFELRKVYSLLDYIKAGTQLCCSIAIDFTASNGDPHDPESLHFMSGIVPNFYEQAISTVGSIIQDYDSDKLFPVLGFGARLPPDGIVSHEFYVNMNPHNPYCNGVQGVLEAYRSCIKQVQLFGPTNFAPVINHVARFAAAARDGSNYFILLILTDGIITDMPQTTQAIVSASKLPLSIIIVGVGNADFSAMETLDGDTVPLSARGIRAARDIVQFVPFNKFLSVGDPKTARLRLAREVLAEVPTQFISYMKSNNIVPEHVASNFQASAS